MSTLAIGSKLQSGKYEIIKVLGQGGFGITYLVRHLILDTYYAVKEFFPQDYCNRDSTTSHITVATLANTELVSKLRNRFVTEAKNMTRLKHSGIISIHDIFEENGTAYYVMDYIEGKSLDEMVTENGPMQEKKALEYIHKVSEAVAYIHDNHITHFDLKPANIMIRRTDNQPVLIDFGLSKQYTESGHARSTLLMGVSHGFSPLEQYMQDGIEKFSPGTDVYALGATLYFLITGRIPPEALKLVGTDIEIPESISLQTREAIKWAMKSLRQERCPSAVDFMKALDSTSPQTIISPASSSSRNKEELQTVNGRRSALTPDSSGSHVSQKLDSGKNNDTGKDKKDSTKKRTLLYVILACVAVIVLVVGIVFLRPGTSENRSEIVAEEEKVSDEEMIKLLVDKWNKAHNDRDEEGLFESYADEVFLYTKEMSAEEAAKLKIDLLLKDPSWHQNIVSNVDVMLLSDSTARASFIKESNSSKGAHTYSAYFELKKSNGEWRIVKESDETTDNNLAKKKSDIPNDAISGDFDGDGQIEYVWTSAKYDSDGYAIGKITLKSDNPNLDGLSWNGGMGVMLFNLGDLNNSGIDFLGCIPYAMSTWCEYQIFGMKGGKWKEAIKPFSVYLGDEDTDRVRKADKKGYIEIKTQVAGEGDDDMDSMFEPKIKIVKLNW